MHNGFAALLLTCSASVVQSFSLRSIAGDFYTPARFASRPLCKCEALVWMHWAFILIKTRIGYIYFRSERLLISDCYFIAA